MSKGISIKDHTAPPAADTFSTCARMQADIWQVRAFGQVLHDTGTSDFVIEGEHICALGDMIGDIAERLQKSLDVIEEADMARRREARSTGDLDAARDLWRRYQYALTMWSEALYAIEEIEIQARCVAGRPWDGYSFGADQSGHTIRLYRGSVVNPSETDEKAYPGLPFERLPEVGNALFKRRNRKIRLAYRAECRRLGRDTLKRAVEKHAAPRREAELEIIGLEGVALPTLLLKLAYWRDAVCYADGTMLPSPEAEPRALHSAYESLVAATGFDPNREAVIWRKEWRAGA